MPIEGRTVAEIREMTDAEHDRMGWSPDNRGGPQVVVLDDGTVLFPVRDVEGNGPGAFTGTYPTLPSLEGAVVESLFPMSDEYMERLGWGDATGKPTVVTFEDDTALWPAQDAEGNNYGCLRAYDDDCSATETFEFSFTPV